VNRYWEDAVTRGDVEAVRAQLDAGTDINARDRYGQTALMLAARSGNQEVVEALIAHGADLDVTAKYNLSAVMLAVLAGHPKIVRALAQAGADLRIQGSGTPGFAGKTAYDLAVVRGMTEVYADLRPR
jgi:ankyrin repeat protein